MARNTIISLRAVRVGRNRAELGNPAIGVRLTEAADVVDRRDDERALLHGLLVNQRILRLLRVVNQRFLASSPDRRS